MDTRRLRSIIMGEMKKILQDDALFSSYDHEGMLDSFDIPGDHFEEDDIGRNLGYGRIKSDEKEGRMTKKQLYSIFRKAESLYDMLRDEDDLPEWVQSKIAVIADNLDAVFDHLEYKYREHLGGEELNFTGDVGELPGEEAFAIGYAVGEEGL